MNKNLTETAASLRAMADQLETLADMPCCQELDDYVMALCARLQQDLPLNPTPFEDAVSFLRGTGDADFDPWKASDELGFRRDSKLVTPSGVTLWGCKAFTDTFAGYRIGDVEKLYHGFSIVTIKDIGADVSPKFIVRDILPSDAGKLVSELEDLPF